MKIFFGIIIFAVGVILIMKTEWFYVNFGRIAWFEEKLGPEGGSRMGYKILGLIGIFFGLMLITGLFGGFASWALSPITKYRQ